MVKSQPIVRYLGHTLSAITLAALLSACSSTPHNTAAEKYEVNNRNGSLLQASQDEFTAMVQSVDVKSRIMNQYANWKGVRYRLGGESRRGIDCSAFVQRTFREQFGLDLPRSTADQQDSGRYIKKSKLRAGDLVLFRSGSRGRHVGIYLGNNHFVHASTSNGVMISSLDDSYWSHRYRQARRVLDNP